MRAIIAKQRSDGSYATVGMNDRTIMDAPKTTVGMMRRIQNLCFHTRGSTYRVEYYGNGIYRDPTRTEEMRVF
jgi:hypothetical protein